MAKTARRGGNNVLSAGMWGIYSRVAVTTRSSSRYRKIYQEQSISQEQPAKGAPLLSFSKCADFARGELIVCWSLASCC
jgi:hypothetical protein